MNIKFIEHWG